jgi:hypothetical protein
MDSTRLEMIQMAFSGWMCLVLGRCFFWKMLGKILENPGAGESMSWISSDFNCFKSPKGIKGQSCGPPNGIFHGILNDELLGWCSHLGATL